MTSEDGDREPVITQRMSGLLVVCHNINKGTVRNVFAIIENIKKCIFVTII